MNHDAIYNETADTRDQLRAKLNEYLSAKGYKGGVVIAPSGTKSNGTQYCFFKCKQGGEYRPHRSSSKNNSAPVVSNEAIDSNTTEAQDVGRMAHYKCTNGVIKSRPETKTVRIGCPYLVYVSKGKDCAKWTFVMHSSKINLQHTCRAEYERTDPRIFPEVRKQGISREDAMEFVQQSSVGIISTQMLRLKRGNDPTATTIPRDIRKSWKYPTFRRTVTTSSRVSIDHSELNDQIDFNRMQHLAIFEKI
ncbi:hypothetical protein BJV82DRAFT_194227 [Fennellomyces sp. T-0311]|nr:hypothetical protein BJV82DRAFT_194227 [Fennellomyces sp. T-0311]